MIRYVYIGDQISEGAHEFAFYNTVSDEFIEFNGEQVFDDIEDFKYWAEDSEIKERCLNLIPDTYTGEITNDQNA